MDRVTLVDTFDEPIGIADKLLAHEQGLLHRAFSLFIVDGDHMLLHQRALGKYHSGGKWTNACCSHPRPGESVEQAIIRRAQTELGLTADDYTALPKFVDSFVYRGEVEWLIEYEYDHIYIATVPITHDFDPDPEEVAAISWASFDDLADSLRTEPDMYSVWFLTAAPRVLSYLRKAPAKNAGNIR